MTASWENNGLAYMADVIPDFEQAIRLSPNEPGIAVWNRCPAVELLSDERGRCAGAVIYNLEWRTFVLVRARAVILATGGAGRLHLNAFPTSNHYGATADHVISLEIALADGRIEQTGANGQSLTAQRRTLSELVRNQPAVPT